MPTLNSKVTRKGFIAGAAGALVSLAGCTRQEPSIFPKTEEAPATTEAAPVVNLSEFKTLAFDMSKWHYDAEHDAWWQLGLEYCTKPAAASYENLAIYVPGAFLKPLDEDADLSQATSSDTFEVELTNNTLGAFSAKTAPIVLPINAPEYAAQTPASNYLYDGLDVYLNAGLIYVYVGFRGRSDGYDNTAETGDGFFAGGCPWSVVGLKAAVRYLRYNASVLPGDTNRIFAFGLGSGGLLASVLGVSGASELYEPYLTEVGAPTHDAEGKDLSDAICGVAAWCPDTAPAHADAAYEWELGQFAERVDTRAEGTWTAALSDDLACTYAAYLNGLGLTKNSEKLTLDETDGGLYTYGSYYDYLLDLCMDAAASFFKTTQFPASIGGIDQPSGYFPGSGKSVEEMQVTFTATSLPTDITTGDEEDEALLEDAGGDTAISEDTYPPNGMLEYLSRADYIKSLNSDYRWISYSEARESVRIAGLSSYISHMRAPSLTSPAYDAPNRSGEENQLFGAGDSETLHFSQDIANLLSDNADAYVQTEGFDDTYPSSWSQDLRVIDDMGYSIESRRNMYDPLYFASASSAGSATSVPAKHWRISVGLAQSTTPITGSVNMALALDALDGVEDVIFIPVWAAPRSLAEPDGMVAPEAFGSWITSLFTE